MAFEIGELTYKPLDVGSQRSEWRMCFENVTILAFLYSMHICTLYPINVHTVLIPDNAIVILMLKLCPSFPCLPTQLLA